MDSFPGGVFSLKAHDVQDVLGRYHTTMLLL